MTTAPATLDALIALVRTGDHAAARVAIAAALAGPEPRDEASLRYLHGCALELAALACEAADERLVLLREAASEHELAAASQTPARVAGATSWGPLVRLGTISLLVQRPDAAVEVFGRAAALAPKRREPRLGIAECKLRLGDTTAALALLQAPGLPLLDDHPDGWVLAAWAAEVAGMLEQAATLLAAAQDALAAGFLAPHRRELLDDVRAMLRLLDEDVALSNAEAPRGPVAQLVALMHGRRDAVPGARARQADRAMLMRAIQRALTAGRAELLVPLLDTPAAALMPNIGATVNAAIVDLARGGTSCA